MRTPETSSTPPRVATAMRLVLAAAMVLLAGCASPPPEDGAPTPREAAPLRIASEAFEDGGAIPREHTCDGAGDSPPLLVEGGPAATVAYALVVLDPDVPFPQAPQRTITHWLAWDFVDGAFPAGGVPPGTVEGGDGREGWGPPCPPPASPAHGYEFTAHALSAPLGLPAGAGRADVEAALNVSSIERATITGMYARQVLPG